MKPRASSPEHDSRPAQIAEHPAIVPTGATRVISAAVLALLFIGSAGLLVTGVTPWPIIALDAVLAVLIIGGRVSWSTSIGVVVAATLALTSVGIRLGPILGITLEFTATLLLILVGAALVATFLARPPEVSVRALVLGASTALVPATCLGLLVAAGVRGTLGYSWAMRNDAVWNTVVARFIIEDAGVDPALHPNASPLTPSLMAIMASFGRSGIGAEGLLLHDVSRAAELWMVLAAVSSVLAGVIAARMARRGALGVRIAAGLVGSILPLAWVVLGYALEFGFYNATVSLVILLAMWLCWVETKARPAVALMGLSAATIAILATWGPLVATVAPLVMVAAVALVRRWRSFPRAELAAGGLSLAAAVAYGLLVTLPDLRAQGGALAANGGIFPFPAVTVAITLAISSAIVLVTTILMKDWTVGVGLASVVALGVSGFWYLSAQRGTPLELDGYYPIKFAWLLLTLVLVLAVGGLFGVAAALWRRRVLAVSVALAGLVLLAGATWPLGPRFAPPRENVFPIANLLRHDGVAYFDFAADKLFTIAREGERGVAARLVSAEYDRFANLWLLQLSSESSEDPIRAWAYYLNPEDPDQLCAALRVWSGPAVVYTSDSALGAELAEACPDVDARVSLQSPDF